MEYGVMFSQNEWNDLNEKINRLTEVVSSLIPKKEDELLNIEEAKNVLKVSRKTISNWINKGVMESSKVRGRVLIRRSEIDRLINTSNRRRF